jgi:5-(carboxyamino)imidazole ribonucleotide synthase
MAVPVAVMANVLGGDDADADVYDRYIHVMAADPAVKVHMYGKPVRPGRKIGHVTVTGDREDWGDGVHADPEELADRARRAASYLRWGKEDGD